MITVTDIFAGAGGSTTGMAPVDGVIVDLFAGPGGWDEGLRMIGRTDVVGVEWDESACRTAEAAGHKRVRADVSALEPLDFVRGAALCDLLGISVADAIVKGLIASPPCQAWSFAGKRGGEADRANCHTLADRMAAGDDSTDWTEWEDERSPLVCQPVRWARELRPEWIALEEVPAVLGLWQHIARHPHGPRVLPQGRDGRRTPRVADPTGHGRQAAGANGDTVIYDRLRGKELQ